jgi:hypothetical protein
LDWIFSNRNLTFPHIRIAKTRDSSQEKHNSTLEGFSIRIVVLVCTSHQTKPKCCDQRYSFCSSFGTKVFRSSLQKNAHWHEKSCLPQINDPPPHARICKTRKRYPLSSAYKKKICLPPLHTPLPGHIHT